MKTHQSFFSATAVVLFLYLIYLTQPILAPEALFASGKAFSDSGNNKKAVKLITKAVTLEQSSENPDTLALISYLAELGERYDMEMEYDSALATNIQLLELYRAVNSQDGIRSTIKKIVSIFQAMKSTQYPSEFKIDGYTETLTAYFRIKKIESISHDSAIVHLDAGTFDGLYAGSTGEAYGVFVTGKDRANELVGTIQVLDVKQHSARALVVMSKPDVADLRIAKGDMAALPARMPKLAYRSILFNLSKINIEFTDNEKGPLLNHRLLMYLDSPQLEEEVLELCTEDIKNTYEYIKDMVDDNPTWDDPIPEGRYAGKSFLDVMKDARRKDVLSFFRFVVSFPGKYMGNTWRVDETFATWLINKSPLGVLDYRDTLFDTRTDKEIRELIGDINAPKPNDFVKGDYYTHFQILATDSAEAGNFDYAWKLTDLILRIAKALNDNDYLGWAYFTRGRIFDIQDKDNDAIEEYKISRDYFSKTNDLKGMSFATNNLAGNLVSLSRYSEALGEYKASIEVRKNLQLTNPEEVSNSNLSKPYLGLGVCHQNMGEFQEALTAYGEAMKLLEAENSLEATNALADLLRSIGKLYEKMGEFPKAIEYFERERELYRKLGEEKQEANALDNIAYSLSKKGESKRANELYQQAYQVKMKNSDYKGAGFSKSNMGQTYWTLGEYNLAIESHNEAIELRRKANDPKGELYSLKKLASLYKESGQPKKAFEMYKLAQELLERINDKNELAELTKEVGENYKEIKDFDNALANFKKALAIYQELESNVEVADLYTKIGDAFYERMQGKESIEYYKKALELQNTMGEKFNKIFTLTSIGLASQFFLFDFAQAEQYFKEALALSQETKSSYGESYAFRLLASLYDDFGKTKKAFEHMQFALNVARDADDKSTEADVIIALGRLHANSGNFDSSKAYYDYALVLADSINNKSKTADAYAGIADLQRMQGHFEKSLSSQKENLKRVKELDNPWAVADSYLGLGNTYSSMGEYEAALTNYLIADSLYKKLDYPRVLATTINNIGTIYYWQGNYDKALNQFFDAYKILTGIGAQNDFVALLRVNIGEVYLDQKKFGEADKWIGEGMELAEKLENPRRIASAYTTYARLKVEQGVLDSAQAKLDVALALSEKTGARESMVEIYGIYGNLLLKKGETAGAKRYLLASVKLANEIGSDKYLWKPLFLLSDLYDRANNPDSSTYYISEAVNVVERIKGKIAGGEEARLVFTNEQMVSQMYFTAVERYIKANKSGDAFAFLEKANSEALRDKFKQMTITFADPEKNKIVQEDRLKKTELDQIDNELNKQLAKPVEQQNKELIQTLQQKKVVSQKEYNSFANTTIRRDPTMRDHLSNTVDLQSFKEAKEKLDGDMAVLLYLIAEKNTYIFVATKDSVYATIIDVPQKQLELKIQALYNILKTPVFSIEGVRQRGFAPKQDVTVKQPENQKEFFQLSYDLYNTLWEPIKDVIANKKNIAVIPNGSLYYLPFQVLGYPQADSGFTYLMYDYSIFYSNRLNFLDEQKVTTGYNLFAMGNPDKSLPYAENEVNELKGIFPGSRILVGDKATRTTLYETNTEFNVLHLATHGILDYNSIENSYLVLAPDPKKPGDDGRFKITDIWEMQSLENYDLVTLSACETAVTFNLTEGWPVTTASAFRDIGIPSVIATLWQVDDAATSTLMTRFYNNLKTMNKTDALREAQLYLSTAEGYTHPYFWAPFLLVGSWK